MILHSFRTSNSVRLLEPPENLVRPVPLGNVVLHNFLRNPRRSKIVQNQAADYLWQRRMMCGFELRPVFAEIRNLQFKRSFVASGKNLILNGASGGRARNFMRKQLDFSEESLEIFRTTYGERLHADAVKLGSASSRRLVIHAKNLHNFYHFLTEALHQALAPQPAGVELESVEIITKAGPPARPFVEQWVDVLAGLLGPGVKVAVLPDPGSWKNGPALMALSAEHLLYQFHGAHVRQIEEARPPGESWTGYDATPHPVKILQLNSFDATLSQLRSRLIALAGQTVPRRWSRNIYVRRSPGLVRKRVMKGEEHLVAALEALGFETVYFEELSPLEQVACVHGADCIVMQHGAGLTNMLFARPSAHVFELGTYQTMLGRWGDFMPLCHAAGCHYHFIALEMDFPEEDSDPVFAEHGLLPPVLTAEDVERIRALVQHERQQDLPGRIAALIGHCDHLMSRKAYRHAYRLLDLNAPFFDKDQHYWEVRGRLAETCGHLARARECYQRAPDLESARTSLSRMGCPG